MTSLDQSSFKDVSLDFFFNFYSAVVCRVKLLSNTVCFTEKVVLFAVMASARNYFKQNTNSQNFLLYQQMNTYGVHWAWTQTPDVDTETDRYMDIDMEMDLDMDTDTDMKKQTMTVIF